MITKINRRSAMAGLGAVGLSAFASATASSPARAQAPLMEHLFSFGSAGTGEGQFGYVEDFAFTSDGRLLVTDASHAWVQVFDAADGRFLARFGGKGDSEENLVKPEGIAVDASGKVFVADYATGLVQIYDREFCWISTFAGYGSAQGTLSKPEFMTIHGEHLYVPEAGNHRVSVFDLNGMFQFSFGTRGSSVGGMNNPEAIKAGPHGQLYLTDLRNDRIQVFDAVGKPLLAWGSTGNDEGQFRSPAGLALDRNGRVYVTEIGNDRVQAFDEEGRFLGATGRRGSKPGEFANLHGIAIHPRTELIYIADTGNNRVQVFRSLLGDSHQRVVSR